MLVAVSTLLFTGVNTSLSNEKLGDKNKLFDALWQNGALGYLDKGSNGEEEVFFTANEYLEFLLPRNKQIYILRSCLIDALGIRNEKWDQKPVLIGH